VIACGALAGAVRRALRPTAGAPDDTSIPRTAEVHSLSALLHNRPDDIAPAVEALALRLLAEGRRVVVAYADCGTYGRLDEVCRRLGLERLPGLHCYDLLAGADTVEELFEEAPGTYLLTDFMVQGFERLVVESLGLDRHPELLGDYFCNYERVVWLTESDTPPLLERAEAAASLLGLPLEVRRLDGRHLHRALVQLVSTPPPRRSVA
jgi:hypothetical protein